MVIRCKSGFTRDELADKTYKALLAQASLPQSSQSSCSNVKDRKVDYSSSKAKILLENLKSSEKLLLSTDKTQQCQSVQLAVNSQSDIYNLPIIKTAAERAQSITTTKPMLSLGNSSEPDISCLKIKTRLNGKHAREWTIKLDGSFSEVLSSCASYTYVFYLFHSFSLFLFSLKKYLLPSMEWKPINLLLVLMVRYFGEILRRKI